jgi:hypothetical protein
MIYRSFDPRDLEEGTDLYREFVPADFDFAGWVGNTHNILLKDEDSIGFVTFEYPGVYSVHHFHKTRRGRAAIDCSGEMMKFIFDNYPIQVIRGLTRSDHRAALWIARHLGMKSYGVFDTHGAPHELFMLTREQFYEHHNRRTNK